MSEQEKFLARLGKARDEGLVDVKFFFHPSRAVEPEDIFAGLNNVEVAIETDQVLNHGHWSGDEPAAVAA